MASGNGTLGRAASTAAAERADAAALRRLTEENTRLQAELDKVEEYTALTLLRATRLAQLVSVLGNDVDLDSIAGRTVTEITELFAADVTVLLLRERGGLHVTGLWGVRPGDVPDAEVDIPAFDGLTADEPVVTGAASELGVPDFLQRYRLRDVAWANLRIGATDLGFLLLGRRSRVPFNDSDATELRAVATRVATAVDNGLLHRRMKAQLARSQRMQELVTELAGILDIDEICDRLGAALVREVPLSSATFHLARDEGTVAARGPDPLCNTDEQAVRFPLMASTTRLGHVDAVGVPPPGSEGRLLLEQLVSISAITISKGLLYAQSQEHARHDSLTGLLGHRVFHEVLEQQLRTDMPFSVALLDIDDFKQVNDQHGHQTGDLALQAVANCLRSTIRSGDEVFRIGGEEFCVILADATAEQALIAAERIRSRVGAITDPLPLTVSIGVAEHGRHARTRDELVAAADAAMYRSKRTGKDRVSVADAI